jgi:hypothetical protein
MIFPILVRIFALSLLCVATAAQASYLSEEFADSSSRAAPPPEAIVFFDMRLAAGIDDLQLGGRVGVGTLDRIGLDFFLDFELRPYRKAVRVRESDVLHYQFREDRFTIGPGVLVRFPLGSPQTVLVGGGGGALSFGDYRGTRREAPFKALPWFETGIRFNAFSGTQWGLSYQVFPLPGVSPHRVAFHLGYRLRSL